MKLETLAYTEPGRWVQLPRSIRLTTAKCEYNVFPVPWPFCDDKGNHFRFTVMQRKTGHYIVGGAAPTLNEACDAALASVRLRTARKYPERRTGMDRPSLEDYYDGQADAMQTYEPRRV